MFHHIPFIQQIDIEMEMEMATIASPFTTMHENNVMSCACVLWALRYYTHFEIVIVYI